MGLGSAMDVSVAQARAAGGGSAPIAVIGRVQSPRLLSTLNGHSRRSARCAPKPSFAYARGWFPGRESCVIRSPLFNDIVLSSMISSSAPNIAGGFFESAARH
jgi:hypothetical protein